MSKRTIHIPGGAAFIGPVVLRLAGRAAARVDDDRAARLARERLDALDRRAATAARRVTP